LLIARTTKNWGNWHKIDDPQWPLQPFGLLLFTFSSGSGFFDGK
jgi:hypothetical protein